MPCIKAETIYTGNEVIRDAYLHLDGERVSGVSQQAEGKILEECRGLTPVFIDQYDKGHGEGARGREKRAVKKTSVLCTPAAPKKKAPATSLEIARA